MRGGSAIHRLVHGLDDRDGRQHRTDPIGSPEVGLYALNLTQCRQVPDAAIRYGNLKLEGAYAAEMLFEPEVVLFLRIIIRPVLQQVVVHLHLQDQRDCDKGGCQAGPCDSTAMPQHPPEKSMERPVPHGCMLVFARTHRSRNQQQQRRKKGEGQEEGHEDPNCRVDPELPYRLDAAGIERGEADGGGQGSEEGGQAHLVVGDRQGPLLRMPVPQGLQVALQDMHHIAHAHHEEDGGEQHGEDRQRPAEHGHESHLPEHRKAHHRDRHQHPPP